MVTRRKVLQSTAVAGAGLMLGPWGWARLANAQVALLDAGIHPKFVNPLLMPSRIEGKPGKTLKAEIKEKNVKLGLVDSRGKKLKTEVWGFKFKESKTIFKGDETISPGSTIIVQKDKPLSVKWENKLDEFNLKKLPPWMAHLLPMDVTTHLAMPQAMPKVGVPLVTHLHGGHTESASDGLPEAWFTEEYKETGPQFVKEIYRYDNDQDAATLWYHDHTLGITRLNVYAGLAGFYLIRDEHENDLIDNGVLPDVTYEKELVIQDRMFTADGQLFLPSTNPEIELTNPLTGELFLPLPPGPSIIAEFFGDFNLVNATPWPVLDVEPRKYRFRILNGADSRFYILRFDNNMSLLQIGTEQGLLPRPVSVSELLIAPGERVDIIVDFAAMSGQNLILNNFGPDDPFKGFDANGNVIGGSADPATTGQVMRFRVNQPFDDRVAEASVDLNTSLNTAPAPEPQNGITRKVVLFEGLDEYGRLQPILGTLDEGSRAWFQEITESPELNDVEVWEIYNTTEDAHPIHIHLISFLIVNRESFTGTVSLVPQSQHNGEFGVGGILDAGSIVLGDDARPPEANEAGWKDTVIALPGEVTRVITSKFDRKGRYVWHCHILSHEDHEMMRPLEVV